jgi:hypothetical protein
MAKSPLAKNSKQAKHIRNSKNVAPLHLMIPCWGRIYNAAKELDVSHLSNLGANKNNVKIESRVPYLRSFCKRATQYVDNGNSAKTVTNIYITLQAYISFCDATKIKVDPFSEEGYLKYVGNDGELRHRMKMYNPSKKIWERQDMDELGIKDLTATTLISNLRVALTWCGLPADSWAHQHRGFSGENTPFKGYSETEEQLLITRLSNLFFTLAPQLIAAKKQNLILPDAFPISINLGEYQEIISIKTSLQTNIHVPNKSSTAVKYGAAFNLTMGSAYHLMCFFTSLNDSNIRAIAHPITIHTDERDKSLQVVKVSSYKPRSNKEVDAVLTNDSFEKFDIDKRDGVKFINILKELSTLYGGGEKGSSLLFVINNKGEENESFNLTSINKQLATDLNLISPTRASTLPWFKELFYSYRNQQLIDIKKEINDLGRVIVRKTIRPCTNSKATQNTTNVAYCILTCYTDLSLKGVLLPLSYSEKDSDGNINVSFKYRNGESGNIIIPAADKTLIQDIEQFAEELADKQASKKYERLLLKRNSSNVRPRDWEGISAISCNQMTTWSIESNDYFISLQSSRWREMASNQVYSDIGISGVQSILQNLLVTIDKHYVNGDSIRNKIIISQAIKVIEQLNENTSFEQAKEIVIAKLGVPMLTHDEWKKKQEEENAKTNPNGINCNGLQNINGGKSTHNETNNAIGLKLPCAEYDMCYKCQSAKAVDDITSIYKLISFIEVLKDALDLYPDAKDEIHDKIAAFEFTLDGASNEVYEGAMALFNKNGRHPRVSTEHAILTLYR